MTLSEQKQALRHMALMQRKAMPSADLAEKSAAIRRRLEALTAYDRAAVVLSYVSLPGEVDTHRILRACLAAGRRVLVPRCLEAGGLAWCVLKDWDDLAPGAHGVLAPRTGIAVDVRPLADSICLVPGLAFDRAGYRLGYGGGYFDRFLAGYPGTTIGLVTGAGLVDCVPREAHDLPVNMIVTENGSQDARA